jgi:putative methyltransferase (TIGR04325 family)
MLRLFKRLQLFIPPILADFLKRNMGYLGYAGWKYVPEGFNRKVNASGWNLDSIAKLQVEKWDSYVNRIKSSRTLGINHESPDVNRNEDPFFHNLLTSFAYVLSLSAIGKGSVKFLDWGGGIGHYGVLAEELIKSTNIGLEYYNYDFEAFGNYGKKLNPSYHYFSDENLFTDQKFDLLMASSSLWYEPNWQLGVDKLCKFNAEYVYITRMIFVLQKPSYVAIQKPKTMGYETEYLFWILNKSEFLDYMQTKNFRLIREFEFGEVTPIFKAPEQGTMKGYLFKKTSPDNLWEFGQN